MRELHAHLLTLRFRKHESFWRGAHLTIQDDFHAAEPSPLLQIQGHPHLRLMPTLPSVPCISLV